MKNPLLLMGLLLLLAVFTEQYFLVPFFPWISEGGSICPMIVFLDIPLRLPVMIDLVPVTIFFSLFYSLFLAASLSRQEIPVGPALRKKLWNALLGWGALLSCMAAAGTLFWLIEGHLSKMVSNGIDSVGIRMDIQLPYPFGNRIRLHGSMIGLLGFVTGTWILQKKVGDLPIAEPIPVQAAVTVIPPEPAERKFRQIPLEGQGMMRMPKTRTPFPGMYPCVMEGEIKPAVFRMKDSRSAQPSASISTTS